MASYIASGERSAPFDGSQLDARLREDVRIPQRFKYGSRDLDCLQKVTKINIASRPVLECNN